MLDVRNTWGKGQETNIQIRQLVISQFTKLRAWGGGSLVKVMEHNQEDLSSMPRTHLTTWTWAHMSVPSITGQEAVTAGSQVLLAGLSH